MRGPNRARAAVARAGTSAISGTRRITPLPSATTASAARKYTSVLPEPVIPRRRNASNSFRLQAFFIVDQAGLIHVHDPDDGGLLPDPFLDLTDQNNNSGDRQAERRKKPAIDIQAYTQPGPGPLRVIPKKQPNHKQNPVIDRRIAVQIRSINRGTVFDPFEQTAKANKSDDRDENGEDEYE